MKLHEAVLLSAAGTTGAGLVAWRTKFPWIGHDLKLIKNWVSLAKVAREALQSSVIDKFEKHAKTTPKNTFLIFEDNMFTYEFVDNMACKVANIAMSWGLQLGDTVALMAQNEPAFIWTFLGLQKLGIKIALINYHLRTGPLVHSVLAAEPKLLILGSGEDLLTAVSEVLDELKQVKVYIQGIDSQHIPLGMHSFDSLMLTALPKPICPTIRKDMNLTDTSLYIYTSGTTGNPKPAFISHTKANTIGFALLTTGMCKSDIVYNTLPLYHTSGSAIGLFGTILMGATMVMRRKFSARHFWADCRRYDVTIVQYIGELFRYLVAQPPNELDAQHKVKAAFGNGMRRDIWEEVAKRFRIPLIVEFYASTEGTTGLLNLANKPGAVGRMSPITKLLDPDPKYLVKFDYATALPIRDKNGRCIPVEIGEPGLFVSRVPSALIKDKMLKVYRGSDEANEKKLIRDAFEPGDIYFNHGDVLIQDKEYFVYFHDRIGDTFRWKGENVSTTEVANVLTGLPFVQDANVYGVKIPGHDGRAGMVAITMNEGHTLGERELRELYDLATEQLPTYARPLFIRQLSIPIITGTFKQRKVELVNDAYNLDKITDPLFFLDTTKSAYRLLTPTALISFLKSKL